MIEVKEHIPLAPLTTFEIGGVARYFVDVRTEEEIKSALSWAKEHTVRFIILAGGSNVLIPDEGLDALVIHIVDGAHSFESGRGTADAGCDLYGLIKIAGQRGYGGWESLAGIPGTIGGAVRGNAGAFGSEIKDFITTISALNTHTGEVREFSNAECDFSYRHSFFKDHPEWIVLRAQLVLQHIDTLESSCRIEETIRERERRHLQNVRAAGSFFMNPVASQKVVEQFEQEKGVASRENRVPAGWLIEKVGMKGAMVGGAIASLQHPNYLVNANHATARDVQTLAHNIKAKVSDTFGVALREEAVILA